MGFFNKLKQRLFSFDVEKIQQQKNKQKPQKNIHSEKKLKSLEKKQAKVLSKKAQEIEKEAIKKREKLRKVNQYVSGLSKSGTSFAQSIKSIQSRHNQINEDFFEDLEETLIMSDISYSLVLELINEIKQSVKQENVQDMQLISEIIVDKIFSFYTSGSIVDTQLNIKHQRKNIILIVGVNGSGKTTTIGKLGQQLQEQGFKVLIAAADTFRAGAVEQLAVWAQRINAGLIKSEKESADPASVVFEALKVLETQDYDVLLIDTAGRLQNKVNLMQELKKIYEIIHRKFPDAPHESLLVLDATTGQNGVMQAKIFKEIANLSGIILTKMDGTSRGGIILTIKDELDLNVKYVGLGEKISDLLEFNLDAFIYGLTKGLIEK